MTPLQLLLPSSPRALKVDVRTLPSLPCNVQVALIVRFRSFFILSLNKYAYVFLAVMIIDSTVFRRSVNVPVMPGERWLPVVRRIGKLLGVSASAGAGAGGVL